MHVVKSGVLNAPGAHGVHATALAADMEPGAHAWQLQVVAFKKLPAWQAV